MKDYTKVVKTITFFSLLSSLVFGQMDIGLHLLKMDKVTAQLKAIEAAIHFENILMIKEIYREYLDQTKISFELREAKIENEFINIFKVLQKNNYKKNYAKLVQLHINDVQKNIVVVKAKILGNDKSLITKKIPFEFNKKDQPIFSYEELKALLSELGGKLK